MNFVIYLGVGGIAGWLASLLMRRDSSMGILANIVVGILGGVFGGWALPRLGVGFGGGWIALFVTALIGAIALLLLINVLTRGRAR